MMFCIQWAAAWDRPALPTTSGYTIGDPPQRADKSEDSRLFNVRRRVEGRPRCAPGQNENPCVANDFPCAIPEIRGKLPNRIRMIGSMILSFSRSLPARLLRLALLAASTSGLGTGLSLAAAAKINFTKDIEPILVKKCSECHGPDAQKSGLRLDLKSAAFKGGKSGKSAIVPGKSAESDLIARVTTTDADEVMPPKGDRLTPAEISSLRQWIDQGADWPEWDPSKHWSFTALRKPVPPTLPSVRKRIHNEIDRFILAKLQREGLKPAAEADRPTLIRRLTLDLTGLPPTWSEVQTFVNDKRADAYERLVDRLLDSEHYGEHMARWWLDLARYADSNGYQIDSTRSMWPYRDWVIRAFNENMPFDRFTIEQLAGDLIPNATLQQIIATGFNRNTKINDEGGSDNEEHRVKAVKDRVATVGTTWLGLTMMCAECHTHKYDPITHEEYYRFYAFFNHTEDRGSHSLEPTVPVPAPPVQAQVDFLHRDIQRVKNLIAREEASAPARQQAWEQSRASTGNVWTPLVLTNLLSNGGSSYTNLPDHSVLGTGINPIYDTITFEAETTDSAITAVLLEVLPDPSLPKKGPGRWRETGNFILDEFGVSVSGTGSSGAPVPVSFGTAMADWEQRYYRAEHAIDRNPKTGWAIGPQFGKPHFLIVTFKEPVGGPQGTRLHFRFDHYHGSSHTIGRFRLSVTTQKDPAKLWPVPGEIDAILASTSSSRSIEELARVREFFRGLDPALRSLDRELYRLNKRELDLASSKYSTLVMKERSEPRETFVQVRGNFLEKGPSVTPGTPAFLPPLPPGAGSDRLALAQWLVDPRNPLPARVTVNRLWERFFGTGLAQTSDDLGRQGEAPSHPELLDWLAAEWIAHGWDFKSIQKTMVLSATYRQNAAADKAKLEKDPYNRWLARGPRFRMDAEMIRDQALAVSGLLNPAIGGPSVHPVQVPNLWKEIGFLRPELGMDEWPLSTGPDLYRRGVYTYWRRVCTYPVFAVFDAPSREVCTARRPRTNTPLQALAALNDSTLLEAARGLAERVLSEGGSGARQQLEFAFRTALSRIPTRAERQRLLGYLEQQIKSFSADPESARLLAATGQAPRRGPWRDADVAAWMMVANVLFNLDENLTKG
ncbi:MAG: DUF1549 domain-containing protein [Verrucomicrobia bacterium]|nr:DUF1549 domain-containing protein [Verrucomicrobiota bacterium]